MDLSYPIFKLEERARHERECLEAGVEGFRPESSGAGQETTYGSDEDAQRGFDNAKARADACEEAVRILRAASPALKDTE